MRQGSAPHLWMDHSLRDQRPQGSSGFWAGSLIHNKRDLSGNLYMRNRYYDPSSGRFTQEDPIGIAGGLNVYGFANGDPANRRDPWGLCATEEQAQDTITSPLTNSEEDRVRCIANHYLAPEAQAGILNSLDRNQIRTGSPISIGSGTNSAAYVQWFTGVIVFSGGERGYITNFDERSVAFTLAHEYKHVLQQSTGAIRQLIRLGAYESFRAHFEQDADSYAALMVRPPRTDSVLGATQVLSCPVNGARNA